MARAPQITQLTCGAQAGAPLVNFPCATGRKAGALVFRSTSGKLFGLCATDKYLGIKKNRIYLSICKYVHCIVPDGVIGDAAAPLVLAGDHVGDELALRLDVEEGAEVHEREEALDGRIEIGRAHV